MAEAGGRLLILSSHYPPDAVGGAEIVAHRHARQLKARGWDVCVLAGMRAGADRRPGTLHVDWLDGIPVHRLVLRGEDVERDFRWPHAENVLRAIIGWHRPDIVHAHNLAGLGASLVRVARKLRCRTIATLHDDWGHCFRHTRMRTDGSACRDPEPCHLCRADFASSDGTILPMRLRRDYVAMAMEEADVLISPSAHLAERYREAGFADGRVTVLSNGIDLDAIPPRERTASGRVDFLAAAYLGEHKGIPVLIEAARMLAHRRELAGRWSLTVAGAGHLAHSVHAACGDPAFGGALAFAGRLSRSELLTRLSESDAVVLPSIWRENEPVVLLEAIASGAAIVASEAGAAGLVTDGENGLLSRTGDAGDLAGAMARMIENPNLVAGFSRANLARRDAFAEQATVDALETLYTGRNVESSRQCPVVICGGTPDGAMRGMIEALSLHFPPGSLRLVRQHWAEADDWSNVRAYLHLQPLADATALLPAMRAGLPLLLRDRSAVPRAIPFSNAGELVAALQRALAESKPVRDMSRLLTRLAPDSSFAFGTGAA